METTKPRRAPPIVIVLLTLQNLLVGLSFGFSGGLFLQALVGFWPALLLGGLYGAVSAAIVWKLGMLLARARAAEPGLPQHNAAKPAVAALTALLLVELGATICSGAGLVDAYGPLDLGRRALGYQGQLNPDRPLLQVGFAADSQSVLLLDYDGAAFWSLSNQSEGRRFDTGKNGAWRVLTSPNGQLLAASLRYGPVLVWRVSDGALLHNIAQVGGYELAFSPDSTLLTTAAADQPTRVWRVSDGQLLQTVPHEPGVVWVGFDPQGRLLSSRPFPRPDEDQPYAFAPDGRLLALGKEDGSVELIDTASGTTRLTLRKHSKAIRALAFSPDGTVLASGAGYSDDVVHLSRVADGRSAASYPLKYNADELAFAPDGRTLAVAELGKVSLWRVPK
ncbi:MAG: hypothetical protein OHK0022_26850 [Roseiflexaceae bacterium]